MAWMWVGSAALCSGSALVLQARAARQVPAARRLDSRLLARLAANATYRAALVLTVAGSLFALVALRQLPVFAVQAGRASSLAVAAVLATRLLAVRLTGREWVGIAVTVGGLVALALSSPPGVGGALAGSSWWLLVAAVPLLALGWWVVARPATTRNGLVLAVLSGCGYALLAVGVHVLPDLRPVTIVSTPAAWAGLCGALMGLVLTATAFQRAPAVAVSALTTTTETVVGSAAGIVLAADRATAGRGALAALGVVLVLVGSVLVARTGAALSPQTPAKR